MQGFVFLTAVLLKLLVFWDATSCRQVQNQGVLKEKVALIFTVNQYDNLRGLSENEEEGIAFPRNVGKQPTLRNTPKALNLQSDQLETQFMQVQGTLNPVINTITQDTTPFMNDSSTILNSPENNA